MPTTVHQQLTNAGALAAWEPLDGRAIVTCKIRSGAPHRDQSADHGVKR